MQVKILLVLCAVVAVVVLLQVPRTPAPLPSPAPSAAGTPEAASQAENYGVITQSPPPAVQPPPSPKQTNGQKKAEPIHEPRNDSPVLLM